MKRFILHSSSLILCLLLALPAFAEFTGLPDGVKANLSAIKKYPKASSILLWVKDSYTLQEGGQQVYERHECRYLPDEASRDNWGDPHIAFIDGVQKVDVLTARAYTADGRTIDATPNNAFNPVTPDELDHAPDFSAFRQLVVSLLGLENVCIAELNYRVTTEHSVYPWLWGRTYFREEVPTLARELSITLPAARKLNYAVANGMPEPLVTGSTYVWRMDEQPGYSADDLRGHSVLLPNVAFTTAKSWPEVTGELLKRIEAASDKIEAPTSLQQKLLGTAEAESKLDSIKAWVHERFNEIEFEHPDFNISIRPASQVLNSGYGNSLELAVLISVLCKKFDITAMPVPRYAFDPPVPYLYDLTGGLLFAQCGEEWIEGDPILPREEFPRAEIADGTFIRMDGKGDVSKRVPSADDHTYLNISVNLADLAADTLHGQGTLVAHGWRTPFESLRADAKDYLQNLLALSGMSVEAVTIKQLDQDNAVVSFPFTASALEKVDGQIVVPLSAMDLAQFAGHPNLAIERKEFPHWLVIPGDVNVHIEAPLPDGWTVSKTSPAVTRAWKDGSGSRTLDVKDGRFVFNEQLSLKSSWISPQDWNEFRSFLLETGPRANNTVIFGAAQ